MQHVFVETNWVVEYAAPSPFRVPEAFRLLEKARNGELQLHLPACCLAEAQPVPLRRYQPRQTADSVRQFLKWARLDNVISSGDEETVRTALDKFESQVRIELGELAGTLDALRREPNVEALPLSDAMMKLAMDLSTQSLGLQPFDLSILAAVLVRSQELLQQGESDLVFCERDNDLQPWDKADNAKQPLTKLYDSVRLWVYGDFAMQSPERPANWLRDHR